MRVVGGTEEYMPGGADATGGSAGRTVYRPCKGLEDYVKATPRYRDYYVVPCFWYSSSKRSLVTTTCTVLVA